MKRRITLKTLFVMLGVLLTMNLQAAKYEGSVTLNGLIYYLYDDRTATVRSAGEDLNGEITILDRVEYNRNMYNVAKVGNEAFRDYSGITSVTLGKYITEIDGQAFRGCTGLTSVTFNSRLEKIGELSFGGCTGLTSMVIPNSVKTIVKWAFHHCTGLTSFTIGSGLETIEGEAFGDCENLKKFIVSGDNANYSSFEDVLFNKDNTILIAFPGGKTSNYVIPDHVTSIGNGAFASCSSLTSVTFGSGITSIGEQAFARSGLTSVTIDNNLTNFGERAFASCLSLTSVTIGNKVTSLGNSVFERCTNLTYVSIGSGLTNFGDFPFRLCDRLERFSVAEDNNTYASYEGVLFNKDKSVLVKFPHSKSTNYTIPDGVTSIGKWAFSNADNYINSEITGLTSITIPNSVTKIEEGAFMACYGLTSVTIPNSVTNIGREAFRFCYSLNFVKIGNSVTTIGDLAFFACENIKEIYSMNTVPPVCGSSCFSVDCTLYVPYLSVDDYIFADTWRNFKTVLPDPTSISNLDKDAIRMYVSAGNLIIENAPEGKIINIRNTAGQTVYQGLANKITLISGIYIVEVGNTTQKVVIG